MQGTFFKGCR